MIRKAFTLTVHAGRAAEYIKRHQPIWPDLEHVLKAHGAHNYSIFLHPGGRALFGYVEVEDEARWASIAATPECQRWWAYMEDIMEYNADHTPASVGLREVFHLA